MDEIDDTLSIESDLGDEQPQEEESTIKDKGAIKKDDETDASDYDTDDMDEDEYDENASTFSDEDEEANPAAAIMMGNENVNATQQQQSLQFMNLQNLQGDITDDDDDDDEYDDSYLQKFDDVSKRELIQEFHPELHSHNSDEIDALSNVVRDKNGVIIDPLHRTFPFITKYEKARIIGERAKQINYGAKPMVDIKENAIDGYLIALKEFEEKKIPFIIKRPLPNGGSEYWKLKDMEYI